MSESSNTKREYDPVKAHEYYERHKKLHPREPAQQKSDHSTKSSSSPPKKNAKEPSTSTATKQAMARVSRLKIKTAKLEGALTEAEQALVRKRAEAAKTKRQNSDGKSTTKEKRAAKEYRDKNKAKLQAKSKSQSTKSSRSSSSSSGGSSGGGVDSMTVDQLSSRVSRIHSLIKVARAQLSEAQKKLGSLAHSDILVSEAESGGFVIHTTLSRKESVKMTEDFGGYATRHDVQCSDGRTILPGAFQDQDGSVVPLLWQHGHNDVDNVLGHCKLEYRDDGVYAHAFFNNTPRGQSAKEQVRHGDIKFLSIFANRLVERPVNGLKGVAKGVIREVSLVLGGANPGAFIDNVNIVHSDGDFDIDFSEAVITTGFEVEIAHADTAVQEKPKADSNTDSKVNDSADGEKTLQDVLDTLNEEQTQAVEYLLTQALTVGDEVQHSDTDSEETSTEASTEEGNDSSAATTEESAVASTEAEEGSEEADSEVKDKVEDSVEADADSEAGDNVQHDNINSQEDSSMTHNLFDQANRTQTATEVHERVTLSHSDVQTIMQNTIKKGSLHDALEDYALAHGIENIEYLFPDAKTLDSTPNFLSRRMEWVSSVLDSVRKTPFSRIRTVHADITADEARAKGYIKGNMKQEEFFTLMKRETTPQTVYKKQKLDRDDVLDITDLDVVAFMKAEMKVMLDEEVAAAILIGDGRSNADADKVKEDKVRPIASDDELYAPTINVNLDDSNSSIEELVDAVIKNRKYYKGTGTPVFYTSEDVIGSFLTVKNGFGQRIYADLAAVAQALRVSTVVPVEAFSRVPDLVGIMVNLTDYSIGTDRGGEATMFDDFDLDYNKLIYLLETRLCGALTLPKSALVFRKVAGTDALVVPTEPTFDGTTVTVPTITGVTYMNADTSATLTTGSPVTLASGETLNVMAVPTSGYYFADNVNDEWSFTNEG